MPEEGLINPKYCLSCQQIGKDKTDFIFHIYNTYTDISTISTEISTAQAVVRRCCPAWLHEARVRLYLGTLTPGEMGSLVTASRQAQNYFHHNTMFALPYFNDLTAKWVYCKVLVCAS